jgi:hypothetical protein
LQGWTRTVLRLDEDELDAAFALADEPFAPSILDSTVALRASFVEHAVHGTPIDEAYAAQIEPRKARGHWPVGALEGIARREHEAILDRWRASLESLKAAGQNRFSSVRFGSAESEEASVEVLDPIVIAFDDDPRAPGSGRPLRVEIVGRTELLGDGLPGDGLPSDGLPGDGGAPRSSLRPLVRGGSGARGRVNELRHALRAYFDHAALSASGREVEVHRAVHLLGDRDDASASITLFRGGSAESARAWLSGLVRDLLSRRHAYLMPCEAMLRLAERWSDVRGEDIVASIEEVRDRWSGGQSRYGPVREPLRYPPLPAGEAWDAAERRFGPFLRAILPRG